MTTESDTKYLADLIKKNIQDITAAVIDNLKDEDTKFSLIAAYSGLVSVMSYFDFRLREIETSNEVIEQTKKDAEVYVLGLIAEELNMTPQKEGKA